MSFPSFREAFQRLEALGKVLRVDEEVSADFEAPLLVREVSRRVGKAVLLTRVRGKEVSLASGIYFGKSPRDLGLGSLEELCQRYSSWVSLFDKLPMDASDRLTVLASVSWIAERFPRVVQFPSSEYEVKQGYDLDLTSFPAIRHSPREEAPSVVNPVIVIRLPQLKNFIAVSHPVEVVDEKTMLIAAPARSPLHDVLSEAAATRSRVSAEVVIGAPPPAQLASAIEWVVPADTFTFMGVLAGSPAILAKTEEELPVLLGSEVVLLGEIEPGDSRPGGRLLQEDGYLAEEVALPVFKPRKALIRRKALFYTSIVSRVFSDTVQISKWRDKLLLVYLQRLSPVVKDVRVLPETAFRAIAVAVKRSSTRDLLRLGMHILSMRVSSRLNTVIFVDEDVDVDSPASVLSSIIRYADPERGVYRLSHSQGKESPQEEAEVIIFATSFSGEHLAERPEDEVVRRVENLIKRLLSESRVEKI
ncbi:MAG: UbiD family decarboxylase [Thermofilum sp.]